MPVTFGLSVFEGVKEKRVVGGQAGLHKAQSDMIIKVTFFNLQYNNLSRLIDMVMSRMMFRRKEKKKRRRRKKGADRAEATRSLNQTDR
ncbi:hypothetical protein TWF481_011461 [Arthrobotrys musiformis]|uniref:Uncharacterized protein n=1 Tax=Arthrobotrys musiformis TaxID=47236 RepID=A0AAV9W0V4_9PEZI